MPSNCGFAASLEVRKLYPFISDADAEANDLIRLIDESANIISILPGYSASFALPGDVQRALRMAS